MEPAYFMYLYQADDGVDRPDDNRLLFLTLGGRTELFAPPRDIVRRECTKEGVRWALEASRPGSVSQEKPNGVRNR